MKRERNPSKSFQEKETEEGFSLKNIKLEKSSEESHSSFLFTAIISTLDSEMGLALMLRVF